jgi:M-phase inducer tyrosine phosphatase
MYIPGYITLKSTFLMVDIANMCKTLEAKEPSMNNHVYPRIHYPEVYMILDEGCCKYVQEFGSHCDSLMGYVTMDNPAYTISWHKDLGLFQKARTFGRTLCYVYDDGALKQGLTNGQQVPKEIGQQRNTVLPLGNPAIDVTCLFAATNAACTKLGSNHNLSPLKEIHDRICFTDNETDTKLDDSPCFLLSKTNNFAMKHIGHHMHPSAG